MNLLSARALTLRIGDRPICTGFDFTLSAGEHWALLGCNGIGKTTLLHTLAGLRHADGGSVQVDGIDLRAWRRKALARVLGILFQDSQDSFPCTVLDASLSGRHPHLPFWRVEGEAEFQLAEQALAAVELSEAGRRQVDTLSGGERRRLAIATLLVQDPVIWLLDEPANHLDMRHQVGMLALIVARVRKRNGALLMALHDVNMALRCCTHAALMVDEATLICGPVADVVNVGNLERMYQCPVRRIATGEGRKFYYPE